MALRDDLKINIVESKYFEKALENIKPSLSKTDAEKYTSALAESKKGNAPTYMG